MSNILDILTTAESNVDFSVPGQLRIPVSVQGTQVPITIHVNQSTHDTAAVVALGLSVAHNAGHISFSQLLAGLLPFFVK